MVRSYTMEELENETLYLSMKKDSDIMKRIMAEQEYTDFQSREMASYYRNCLLDYQEYITFIGSLFKALHVQNNVFVLSILLRKLILGGYLSYQNQFSDDEHGFFYEYPYHEGLDVVAGHGVCRHVADFYDDIYQELHLYHGLFPCYFANDPCSLEKAFTCRCDHVLNLVSFDDVLYGYNVFSNSIMKFQDQYTLSEIVPENQHKGRILCFYKPSVDIMKYRSTYDQIFKRLKEFEKNSLKYGIHYDQCRYFYDLASSTFYDNREVIDDFVEEAKVYTKRIYDQLTNAHRKSINDFYSHY